MNTNKLLTGMYHTKIDPSGKITLPAKAVALLPDNLVLVGQGDHLEIWGSEEWERKTQIALSAIEKISEN